jgi:hypothetical protein
VLEPGSFLGGVPLSFRTKAFSPPLENQPAAWLHNALKYYFRSYRTSSPFPSKAQVLARFEDDKPAAWNCTFGKGQVLVLSGVVDWLSCPGLALLFDNWAQGRASADPPPPPCELLAANYEKNGVFYLLGRRFVGQTALEALKKGTPLADGDTPTSVKLHFPYVKRGNYHVQELIGGRDLGRHAASSLRQQGVALQLRPGEGFLLEVRPILGND